VGRGQLKERCGLESQTNFFPFKKSPKTECGLDLRIYGIFVIEIARAFLCCFQFSRKCSCRTSSSTLIGGSGAGWEGTALLNHGSYIKFGCLQFVFSITDFASAAAVAATEATALGSSSAKNQASTESVETCASTSSTVKQTPDGEQPT